MAPARKTVLLALLPALWSCTAEPQDAAAWTGAPRIEADALLVRDGTRLPLRHWPPETPARAVVLGVHGFNDYGNAFAAPASAWTASGIAVYAYDQRGFGAAPSSGRWAGDTAMVADLDDAVTAVAGLNPALPLYVVGVSMGGAVASVALARGGLREADGVVLVAPAVWARKTMPWSHRAALWLASHTVPWLRLGAGGLGIAPSDNREMLGALGADPLVIQRARADAIAGVVDLMDLAHNAVPQVTAPLLFLYGAHDEIVPKAPTEETVCRLRAGARVGVYADGYHMLLRDLQAATVHADVLAWIDDRDAPLPSAAEAEARRFFSCAETHNAGDSGTRGAS